MITTEAIKIAQEIQEAQRKGKIELISNGVLICTDTAAGSYKFVKYEDLPFLDQKTLGVYAQESYNLTKLNEATINALLIDLQTLQENYKAFKSQTIEVIKALENKLVDITEENEVL